jgi:hypothetical protein
MRDTAPPSTYPPYENTVLVDTTEKLSNQSSQLLQMKLAF